MPNDNEVDEKVMPEPLTYGMRRKGETAVIGLIPPKVHANPPKVPEYLRDYEEVPLYSAATVAELLVKADAAERRVGELEKLMAAARRAIGDHHAPNDCYATGPLTGDAFLNLVQCPACAFLDQYANSTKVAP